MAFSMEALNNSMEYVATPYIQNLVTKESCVAFVESTLFWNNILKVIAFVAVIIMFYCMYKLGKFNKEKDALKKAFKADGEDTEEHEE